MEGIWYSQFSKSWQVVECAWLDWCNLIIIHITTKYKIRTKYNDNLRPNKQRENRKTPIYRKDKGQREREQMRNNGPHYKAKVWATGTPLKLELDTKAQEGQYNPVTQVAFIMLITPSTGHMSPGKCKIIDFQSEQTEHSSVHSWHRPDQWIGPKSLNELGTWTTYQLIEAHHQDGVGWRPTL